MDSDQRPFRTLCALFLRRGLLLLLTIVSAHLYGQGTAVVTTFEAADGYTSGSFLAQGPWSVTQGTASITTADMASGTQSLLLNTAAVIQANVSNTSSANIVFIDFYIRPFSQSDPTITTTAATQQFSIRFVRVNDSAVLYYFDGDGSGGGQWKASNVALPVAADGTATGWIRISARENYALHQWDLYAKGALIACRIGAVDNSPTDIRSFTVTGGAGGNTGLDDVYVGPDNPLFTDVNRDGIDDAWEQKWGLSLSVDNRDGDPDGDGATNLEEFMRGTDPVTGAHSITLSNPETAGIAGFRPLWDTPVPVAENGVVEDNVLAEPGRTDYGAAPDAHWLVDYRQNGTLPGGLVFDAVHRSLMVKFPTASQQILDEIHRGFQITKIELVLPFRDTELWPEYYRTPTGLSFLGSTWKNTPPRWHAVGEFLRRPWENDPTYGPTFNANINGVSYWTKYGAQDATNDYFPGTYLAEVSSAQPTGAIDLTTAIAAPSLLGATLADRLDVLNNRGLVIKKLEVYDASYWSGGYEWATETGQRGILVHTPQLVVQFAPIAVPDASVAKPAFDLSTEISRVQQTGSGGSPTAVMPTADQFTQLAAQLGAVQPAWMPNWQWQRVQDLNALPTVSGFTEDLAMEFPTSLADFSTWMDSMLSLPPRRWAGFDAAKKAYVYLRDSAAFPGPVKDHWKLYWWSWLMPDRPWQNPDGSANFVQGYTDASGAQAYYNLTHDWRGNFSVYRSYVHDLGPQDFNYWASAGVMLGGSILNSTDLIAEGRAGFENYPIRTWSWADGSTQESIDHYYFAITLGATKPFADYGPTAYDRLLGKVALTKSIEELATHYHPALRRFISTSGRTGPGYVLGIQDGLQHIIHTLSPSGALTDQGQTSVAGINVLGHDVLPNEVAALSLSGPWAPDWYSNIVDAKILPFQSKLIGSGVLKTSYLGHNYGLASGLTATGTIPFMAQWRRVEVQPNSLRDIGTLLLRYGINRTEFLDSNYHGGTANNPNGIVGNQGGYIQPIQFKNKALVLATPTSNLFTDGARPIPSAISSLQTSIGFYNFELTPGWQLYVDGQLVTVFPVSIKNTQKITIQEGVTYIGIVPLPATNLGRTDDVVISTDGVDTTLQGGGTAKEAIRINNYNFKSTTAVDLSTLDPLEVDAAWGGYAFEISDETEYSSFAAFQQHIAGTQFSDSVGSDGKTIAVQYTSGTDTIAANFDPTGGGSVSNATANGATLSLPPGIVRDTDVSIQGTGGSLQKSGATLLTDAKAMAFLQVEPVSGTYMGVNGLPDLSKFVLEAPGGVVVRSEGKVGVFRAAVRPAEDKLWIDSGGIDQTSPAGRAVIVAGLTANPIVQLDGVTLASNQMIMLSATSGPLFIIPLNGRVDSSLSQDYADTNGNGLPDAWEMKWFRQLGNSPADDPDGDGISNAQEFAAGTNPVITDAWIAKYLGGLDDNPYQDPGNVGRTFLESFRQGSSPWPAPTVADGLRAWYRADMGVSVNSGYYNQIYQWTDLSGSGFHMSANPGVTAPFLTGTMNGHPAVFCQGSWSQVTTTGACDIRNGSNDLTIIAVVKPDPAQSNSPTVIDLGEGGYFPYGIKGNQYNQFYFGWTGGANTQTPLASVSSDRVQVVSGVKNGTLASIYLNGAEVGQSSVTATIDLPPAPMAIGNGTSPHYGYNGLVSEILVYNRALSDAERTLVEQDLMSRYIAEDSDGDGLSDAWEMKYLGTLSYGANDDPGHVGHTLLQSEQSGTSPWPTASISTGLTAWYRADLGPTGDSHGRVNLWPDASGHAHHLATNGATAGPTLVASAMNSLPGLQFASGAMQTVTACDLLSGSSDITVVTVLEPDAAQPSYHKLLRMVGNPDQGWWLGSGGGSSDNVFGLAWCDANGAFQETPEAMLLSNRVQILTTSKSGSTASVFVNGTRLGTNTTSSTLVNPPGVLQFGYVNGKVAEVRVYNRALTDSERQQLEQELMQRYISADSDGDGLPDAWEQQYLGTLTYGAGDDPGQVGRTLAQSYATGLSPWPSPSIASGLRAWYRADLGVSTNGASQVTQWDDVSGNGLHVGQLSSSGGYPTLVAGAMNGKPAVQFADTPLNTNTPVDFHLGSDDMTVIAVLLPSVAQPSYHKLILLGGASDYGFYFGTGGGSSALFGLTWLDSTQTMGEGTGEVLVSSVRPQILSAVKSATNAAIFVNGTNYATQTVDSAIWKPTAVLNVGGFNGQVAELLVYNRALSSAERQQLEGELTQKYVSLDSDHDGLPDAWELQYLGTLAYTGSDDPGHVGRTLAVSQQQGLSPWPAPAVASGLRAWYRADLGVSKDANNNITQWVDLSGNGIHVIQPVGASPQWADNTMNGRPTVVFTGNRIKTPGPVDVQSGATDITVIAALNPDPVQPGYRKVVRVGDDKDQGFYLGGSGGDSTSFGANWMNGTRDQGEGPGETLLTASHPQILTVSKSGTSATLYVNGFVTLTNTVDPTMWTPLAALNIGGFNGKLGEVLIYNRALSDTERRQAELQLAQKFDDTDHDGLPDAWELKWAGNLTTLSDPNADPDQDGITNLQAYLNGASPFAGFNNFDFERKLIGWTLAAGSITAGNFTPGYTPIQHIVSGIEGQFAFTVNPNGWTYTNLTSLPFMVKAGTSALSFQASGSDDYGTSGVQLIDSATMQVLANIKPGSIGSAWRTFSTTFTVQADTVVYLRVYRNGSTVGGGLVFDDIKIRPLTTAFTNFDFEQGWTGWLLAGNTGQIGNAVSDGQVAPQGSNAYQSAVGSGTVPSSEEAQYSQLYSGLFAVHAGQNLFSGQLYGTVQSGNVDLIDSATGAVLAELNRFDSGPVWERCYSSFYLSADTIAFIRICDTSSTSHLAADNLQVAPYVFSNFDFEQGWAGWTLAAGSITAGNFTPGYTPIQHIVAGTQGKRAFTVNPNGWTYTNLTSLPFTVTAGTSVLSFQATGTDDYGTSGVKLVNSTTNQIIATLVPGTVGSAWRIFSTTFTVPTNTVVYLQVYRSGSVAGGGLVFDDIKIRPLASAFTNFDFEQGWTGWLLAGNTGQIGAAVSDGQIAPQGSNAYQSAVGSGTVPSSEEAQYSQLYSGLFAVHAGQHIFSAQLFGAVQSGNVDLIDSATGTVIAELNRFDSGATWERCYSSFYLAADTVAVIRIRDSSSTSHLAVDDLRVTPYAFSNFDFEQGWAGWTLSAGAFTGGNTPVSYTPIQHIVAGVQGKRAFTVNPNGWTYTNLTSLPFTVKAGTSALSFQASGSDDYGTSGVQLIDSATMQVLANIKPGSIGSNWHTFSTTFTVQADTVVYLRVYRNGSTVGGGLVFDDIKIGSAVLATIPQITTAPANSAAIVGSTVTFAGAAIGFPVPTLQWTRNGVPIPGAETSTFALLNIQPSDAGVYALVATNQVGQAISTPATLTVGTSQPPTIEAQPSDQLIQFGATATFSTQASGTAPLQYQWQHDGTDIPGSTGATLTIGKATLGDLGKYRVVVSNAAGTVASADATLAFGFAVESLSPSNVLAGSGAFTVAVGGTGFIAGDTVTWNGNDRPTAFVSTNQLEASLSASDVTLSGTDISSVLITVRHSDGSYSNALPLTIITSNVSTVSAQVAAPSTQSTVTVAAASANDAGVTATLQNNSTTSANAAIAVATYQTNATGTPYFDAGGKFVDVQLTGADSADVATTYFYYPAITSVPEDQLTLLYFDGTFWKPVLSSGGVAPAKDTTDNLDGTISGGRFTVIFDNTSTPKITDLTGTVFTVSLPDTTPPSISAPADIIAEATSPGGARITFAATATDTVSGAVPVAASPASGSMFPVGTTTVTLAATDAAGNVATATFHVTVQDTTPPVIAPPTNMVVEATSAAGATVVFTPTAADLVDGAVAVVANPPSGGTFPLGTTIVTLTATDAHHNASSATFTVLVHDTTPPTLTVPVNIIAEAASAAGATVNFAAQATDAVSQPILAYTIAPGAVFPLGTTVVGATATDAAGNASKGSFSITVVDTTPPSIAPHDDVVVEATGPTGAAIDFTATANDLVDGVVPVTAAPAAGFTFPLGSTKVTLTATDAHHNTATTYFTATVRDTTPPNIVTPPNLVAEATSPAGATVTFQPTANDIVDGAVKVVASPASGSTFPLGTTTVTLTATDAHQNTATSSFTVVVRDTTPPVITAVSASPNSIWPPNKKMVPITLAATATDAVGVSSLKIVSVACNETVPSSAWQITGALALDLLADRDGKGSGRVYTITVEARDAAGNASTKSVTVSVPHDQGH